MLAVRYLLRRGANVARRLPTVWNRHMYGGVFRDGPQEGDTLVKDKKWWQNNRVPTGCLDDFEQFRDEEYLAAFMSKRGLVGLHIIDHKVKER